MSEIREMDTMYTICINVLCVPIYVVPRIHTVAVVSTIALTDWIPATIASSQSSQ